jgi:hypothetical protein
MAIEQLDEMFDYKNQLMEDLLTNKDIVALIDDSVELKNAKKLVYKQVFPYEYIPTTIEEGKTFICCDVDIQKAVNKTYLLPTLYVWVFTHKSKLRLPEGGVRTDKLVSKIAGAINGSRYYGLGELDFYSAKRYAPMTDFQGKVMTFTATDFNRLHNPNKPIPPNRKKG